MRSRSTWRQLLVAVTALLLAAGCRGRPEVVVLCAASLHPALAEAAREFGEKHSRIRVRLEPSGSLVAARKVSELGMRADIVALADAEIIDRMLIPAHATWTVQLGTNEVVLAHMDHSRFTDEIDGANWTEVLLRQGVRLGCADPDTAPLGYRTRQVWQLAGGGATADGSTPSFENRLSSRCAPDRTVPDEGELVSLLESRAVDYAFVYRSTAELHHLKITELPAEVNLSRPDLAARYHEASLEVRMAKGDDRVRVFGMPISYGFTILAKPRNESGALAFAAFLLGEDGRRIFERMGFHPLSPAPCSNAAALPEELRDLVRQAE